MEGGKSLYIFIGLIALFFVIMLFNQPIVNTTVLIQEGHVGRIKGNTGSCCGALHEVKWNKHVGKIVEQKLQDEQIEVVRVGAKIPVSNVVIAVAIHFDGAEKNCTTGASIGYDKGFEAQEMAQRWRKAYGSFFPFKWHEDNFTENLSEYYGFRRVHAKKGFLVLELGELTCKEQTEWLEPRLNDIGERIADFIIKELKE